MSLLPLLWELSEHNPIDDLFGYLVYPKQNQQSNHCNHQYILNKCSRPKFKRHSVVNPYHNHKKCTRLADLNKNIAKDGFQVSLDTTEFAPDEISVKTVENTIVVEGKHEEKEDEHGFISRHFIRKYTLPKEVDVNDVVSTLSTDGHLTIKAPPKAKPVGLKERVIQIQYTGKAHHTVHPKESEITREEKMTE